MRKTLFTVATIGMAAFLTASTASAQCAFDSAGKAKGLKSDMTRAYVPCGSGITFPAPNTVTTAGTTSCTPPTTYSNYLFSAKGKCSVKSKAAYEAPCSDLSGPDCSNVTLSAKCAGMTNPDGFTPISGPGWALNTLARATLDDNNNGDMTVIDFPAQFLFPDAAKGKLQVQSDTNTLLLALFGPGNSLPGCTSLETLAVKIVDPLGRPFANLGTATHL